MSVIVTGGAGFIGSNFILDWLAESSEQVINLDLLTYAGNLRNLDAIREDHRHRFVQGDICDRALLDRLLRECKPRAVINFAAESHVDRSIHAPNSFVQTNVVGTYTLLEAVRGYLTDVGVEAGAGFRYLHVSTDEVYGSLGPDEAAFSEGRAYDPSSPYSASKAASDHLVRAWGRTYGIPVLTTNCSNNYGPYQFPEKLIPLVIANALAGRRIPVYGDGRQVRDWLYVGDHCAAIRAVLDSGRVGEVYNIGGWNEQTNIDVVEAICDLLDELKPDARGSRRRLISYVADRPGHDRRYAIDARKIEREIGWRPVESFQTGLRKTVRWYLDNSAWIADVQSGSYRDWIGLNYNNRVPS